MNTKVKTLKDLKKWIANAEKFGCTDETSLNIFAEDSYRTAGICTDLYIDDMTYNRDWDTVHMRIYISGLDFDNNDLQTKITVRKK